MIKLSIPGRGELELEHLVLDYNGTLALDGRLLEGVRSRIEALSRLVRIHVLTADTFGLAAEGCKDLGVELSVLGRDQGGQAKAMFVTRLGPARTVAIGNGNNDALMLEKAALGIVIMGPEGCSTRALTAADVAVSDVVAALDLLLNPQRLVATLRS